MLEAALVLQCLNQSKVWAKNFLMLYIFTEGETDNQQLKLFGSQFSMLMLFYVQFPVQGSRWSWRSPLWQWRPQTWGWWGRGWGGQTQCRGRGRSQGSGISPNLGDKNALVLSNFSFFLTITYQSCSSIPKQLTLKWRNMIKIWITLKKYYYSK